MKRILMLAFAAALSVSASACQDTTNPSSVLAGTYTLQSIGNQPLPVAVNTSTAVVSGYITIDRNGNFADVVTTQSTGGFGQPQVTETDGTWSLSGSTLQFTDFSNPNYSYYATVSGNQLVLQDPGSGYAWVYTK